MILYIVKNITHISTTTVLLLIIMAACNPTSTQPPRYGVKVQYAQGQPLSYPDLTLIDIIDNGFYSDTGIFTLKQAPVIPRFLNDFP